MLLLITFNVQLIGVPTTDANGTLVAFKSISHCSVIVSNYDIYSSFKSTLTRDDVRDMIYYSALLNNSLYAATWTTLDLLFLVFPSCHID